LDAYTGTLLIARRATATTIRNTVLRIFISTFSLLFLLVV
jgi:hypothetical protein